MPEGTKVLLPALTGFFYLCSGQTPLAYYSTDPKYASCQFDDRLLRHCYARQVGNSLHNAIDSAIFLYCCRPE